MVVPKRHKNKQFGHQSSYPRLIEGWGIMQKCQIEGSDSTFSLAFNYLISCCCFLLTGQLRPCFIRQVSKLCFQSPKSVLYRCFLIMNPFQIKKKLNHPHLFWMDIVEGRRLQKTSGNWLPPKPTEIHDMVLTRHRKQAFPLNVAEGKHLVPKTPGKKRLPSSPLSAARAADPTQTRRLIFSMKHLSIKILNSGRRKAYWPSKWLLQLTS